MMVTALEAKQAVAIDEALTTILMYGGIDGAHHKQWVLDQVVRILTNCPDVSKTNNNFTYSAKGESEEYKKWVENYCTDEDGNEYEWDEGIAP